MCTVCLLHVLTVLNCIDCTQRFTRTVDNSVQVVRTPVLFALAFWSCEPLSV